MTSQPQPVYVDFIRKKFVLTSSMFIRTIFGLFWPAMVALKNNTLNRISIAGIVNSMILKNTHF